MAVTTYGVNDALAVKLWSKRMDVEALKETVASEYIGKGTGSLCQLMDDTLKGPGDSIRFGIRMLATGIGTGEADIQEGNEESLSRFADTMLINELGNAHRVPTEKKIDVQRVPYNLREECYDSLKDWAADRIDTWFFNQLAGNTSTSLWQQYPLISVPMIDQPKFLGFNAAIAPSATRVIRGGAVATDQLCVGVGQQFTLAMIDAAVNRAKQASPMIRPIKGLGKDIDYVCFLHPDQVLSLRRDTVTAGNWFDLQGKRLQGSEGDKSGLYTGVLGIYNRTLLVENFRVPQGINSGSGVAVANTRRAIFCGAQALSMAFGKTSGIGKFDWVEETFDYQRGLGVRASFIAGIKKTVYNSVDYGTIVLTTFAAPA